MQFPTVCGVLLASSFLFGISLAKGPYAAFYAGYGQCSGTAVLAIVPGGYEGCWQFSGGANMAGLWGQNGDGTTCSVYASSDCSGGYQSVGSSGEDKEACTALYQTSYSAHCYYNGD